MVSKKKRNEPKDAGKEAAAKSAQRKKLDDNVAKAKADIAKEIHFVPTFLLFTILVCSGGMAVMSYRDMFGTGKIIFGEDDEAMLKFTGSTKWFDDSRGWKSTAGGFSSVQQVTTDENDMGAYFVRKLAGAAALAFHLQKLIPILFQSSNFHWGHGHFRPMLLTSVLGNFAVAAFYVLHFDEFKSANAENLGFAIAIALIIEAVIILGFIAASIGKGPSLKAKTFPPGKGPASIVSKIITRTFCIVSGMIAIIAGRDFFFPGQELPFPPHDDIYLEWTGAFIHSPPANSEEENDFGLEAPLHFGDKFISRLMALYVLVVCFQKLVSGLLIRVGKDNSGEKKCKVFWQSQLVGNALILFTFRVFAPAALSASLDLRWHIMCLGYETFMLALYGYF